MIDWTDLQKVEHRVRTMEKFLVWQNSISGQSQDQVHLVLTVFVSEDGDSSLWIEQLDEYLDRTGGTR